LNAHWAIKRLDEIFEIARGGSPRPIEKFLTNDPTGLNWIKISDATASGKFIKVTKEKIKPEGLSKSRFVSSGDFLLTNSMSFGRPYIMATDGCIHDGWLVLKPYNRNTVDQGYFYHLLGSDSIYQTLSARASGSTVKNLNREIVSSVEVKLPPLDEQRRIAAILDKADALRHRRKSTIDLLESLTWSIFLEMFGDLDRYPAITVNESLLAPLRNGLSLSKTGTFPGKILTLSAITGGLFKPNATKEGMFANEAARPRRGQAHPQGCARGPAAGQALCRLPGGAFRPAPGNLLFQRLRALDLGRYPLPAARDRRLLQARRA
jgi:hypothetical protein